MALHDAALDEREEGHHLLHRVRAGVGGEARGEAVGAGGGGAAVGGLVDDDGEAVVGAVGPEAVVGGVAEEAAGDRVGADDHRGPAVVDGEAGVRERRRRGRGGR